MCEEEIPNNGKYIAGCSHLGWKVTTNVVANMYNIRLSNATSCKRIIVGSNVSEVKIVVHYPKQLLMCVLSVHSSTVGRESKYELHVV